MNALAQHEAPARKVHDGGSTGRRRAVLALARLEAVRLLRHPLTVVAVLILVGIWVSGWITNEANHFPVLQDADRDTQLGMMLLIGGAALIAGNLAVLRTHRNGTTALSDVLVLPLRSRTAAHLLALLPVALLAVALTAARIAVLSLAPAAGRPNLLELVTGPVIVVLFGAVGVLLARLTLSPIAAPLTLLAIFALLVVLPLVSGNGPARWFQPVVPEGDPAFLMPAPVDLMARPAGPHLAYLAGLTVLAAAIALARSGARIVRVTVFGGLAAVLAVAGGIAQVRPPSAELSVNRLDAMLRPADRQTCQRRDQVTYCAFPEFAAWTGGWETQVRGLLRRTPTALAQQPFAVRQRILVLGKDATIPPVPVDDWRADDLAAGTPNAVTVGTRWGDSQSAYTFAGLFAYRVVTGELPGGVANVCGARGVLVGWLASQASEQASTGLRLLAAKSGKNEVFLVELSPDAGILLPERETAMVLSLWTGQRTMSAHGVLQAWAELAAAPTSVERAAEILGVPAPAAASPGAAIPTASPEKRGTETRSTGEQRGDCS